MAEQIAEFFLMQIDYELAYVFCLKSFLDNNLMKQKRQFAKIANCSK
jgi:hypothetical protein